MHPHIDFDAAPVNGTHRPVEIPAPARQPAINGGKPSSDRRSALGYVLLLTGFAACPCHLPILFAILGGTALGSALSANLTLLVVGFSAYFLLALIFGLRFINRQKQPTL